jgi:hypothetical protein
MFNIVKRQDFMLGQDIPTWREAEELRREKYGREHIVVIPADTEPGKEFTSTNFLPPGRSVAHERNHHDYGEARSHQSR